MKNKYYTPGVEEFHVGFDYQERVENNIWKNKMYETVDDFNLCYHNNQHTRVKYLDKEDIESLGFKLGRDNTTYQKYSKGIIILGHYGRDSIIISDQMGELFDGYIKNKSELIKLLKQLTI